MQKSVFKKIVTLHDTLVDFYTMHKRDVLPWRRAITPYKVVVSEIMLQQTQVDRVVPFFTQWMKLFPSWKSLAQAQQSDVLRAWKGLGYNSRALRLQKLAQTLTDTHGGRVPKEREKLESLPGIGPYTAGAVRAFVYNEWDVCIETNIRTVIFHHILPHSRDIRDSDVTHYLSTLVQYAMDMSALDARHFYYALMDYGSHLKRQGVRLNAKSKHYTKQSKFKGSDREIRGAILDILLRDTRTSFKKIYQSVKRNVGDREEERVKNILKNLIQEGFIVAGQKKYSLKK